MDKPRRFERLPRPDELALGYAWGEDAKGELYQLKGVSQDDRRAHFYVVGATRTGKTKFLQFLIAQDIANHAGFGVIDPHGDLVEAVKQDLVRIRNRDLTDGVVLIDPTDPQQSVCFNPLELVEGVSPAELANELVLAFKKIWADSWGARMEDILRNTLVALIEKGQTLAEIPLVFGDPAIRAKLTRGVKNEACRHFFEKFEALNRNDKTEWPESTLNKVSAFLSDERVRRIFISPKSTFNLRDVIDNGKILLIKLDKGRLKGAGDLLGSLLLSKIQVAAFSRTDTRPSERKQYYLYIDEFQNFANESFMDIPAEASKYKLSLILVHQNLNQLDKNLRASLLANCGLQAYFRVSRQDAEILAKEIFAGVGLDGERWEDYYQELQSLPPRVCVVKNKLAGGIVVIATPPVSPEHEIVGVSEDEFEKLVREAKIGERYMRDTAEIEREYRERRNLLAAGGDKQYRRRDGAVDYESLIKGGENNFVEFKEMLRWDKKTGNADKIMEHAVAKAVSSFMNSDGGTLFIGVANNGEILGIENDYLTLGKDKMSRDGFLLQLTQIFNTYLGRPFHQFAKISIVPMRGKDVCVVEAASSITPVYIKNDNKVEFYVRSSASSQFMNTQEAIEYIKVHFGQI